MNPAAIFFKTGMDISGWATVEKGFTGYAWMIVWKGRKKSKCSMLQNKAYLPTQEISCLAMKMEYTFQATRVSIHTNLKVIPLCRQQHWMKYSDPPERSNIWLLLKMATIGISPIWNQGIYAKMKICPIPGSQFL
jgi:hypothetical protein